MPRRATDRSGEEHTVDLHQKVNVECVVTNVPAADVTEAIVSAAHTGEGKVFVLPVDSARQIRTGKIGTEAV